MNKSWRFVTILVLAAALLCAYTTYAGVVTNSKHDISTGNPNHPGVCAYCHTPHKANAAVRAPLWNRVVGNVTFQPYVPTTPGGQTAPTPGGLSLACLGCHDGVNASVAGPGGTTLTDKHDLYTVPRGTDMTGLWPNCSRCHANITGGGTPSVDIRTPGTDMRNDHPVSIDHRPIPGRIQSAPDAQNGWPGSNDIKLYQGKIECPSCHNVHDPDIPPFLRKTNAGANLCLTCHIQ